MPDFGCDILSDDGRNGFNLDALPPAEQAALIDELTRDMFAAAEALEFERAADLRDRIATLKKSASINSESE